LEDVPLTEYLHNRSWSQHDVVAGKLSDTVMDALKTMYNSNVSAIAIVDDAGKLVANFSAADVLNLELGHLADLNLSIGEYLKKYSNWSLTPLAVQKEDGFLADAVILFSALSVHRLWIVDSSTFERFAPIGVVTLTDMFSMFNKVQTLA